MLSDKLILGNKTVWNIRLESRRTNNRNREFINLLRNTLSWLSKIYHFSSVERVSIDFGHRQHHFCAVRKRQRIVSTRNKTLSILLSTWPRGMLWKSYSRKFFNENNDWTSSSRLSHRHVSLISIRKRNNIWYDRFHPRGKRNDRARIFRLAFHLLYGIYRWWYRNGC